LSHMLVLFRSGFRKNKGPPYRSQKKESKADFSNAARLERKTTSW
jgi:hypothetical protein